MAIETAYCIDGHMIFGALPYVDEKKFEVQHPELIGKSCDCGRFTYHEEQCPSCFGTKWKIVWREKTNP
jgi:hypothetical protein